MQQHKTQHSQQLAARGGVQKHRAGATLPLLLGGVCCSTTLLLQQQACLPDVLPPADNIWRAARCRLSRVLTDVRSKLELLLSLLAQVRSLEEVARVWRALLWGVVSTATLKLTCVLMLPWQVVQRVLMEVELLLPLMRVALTCMCVDSLQLVQAHAIGACQCVWRHVGPGCVS
jgi:hypothetical protein